MFGSVSLGGPHGGPPACAGFPPRGGPPPGGPPPAGPPVGGPRLCGLPSCFSRSTDGFSGFCWGISICVSRSRISINLAAKAVASGCMRGTLSASSCSSVCLGLNHGVDELNVDALEERTVAVYVEGLVAESNEVRPGVLVVPEYLSKKEWVDEA